ncbi:MAG: M3 family metallopeptidase [Deltaproteobacteria bacterium]|nr:M3 family metallopeptidase [Deltaproteobacteria bacterium]
MMDNLRLSVFGVACAFASSLHAAATAPAAAPVDVPALRTVWTPAELSAACELAEKDTDAKLAKLVAVADDKRTFADSFVAFDLITADYSETVARASFMKDIHPDAPVRDVAAACEERAGKYAVALSARKDLYLAMKGYLENAGKKDKLDPESARLVELTMRDFKRNGLELNDADRAKLVGLRSRLTELQTKFQKNLNDDKSTFTLKKAELAGLPEDFLTAHADAKKKDTYTLTTKYPDYYPIMENAKNSATRKKMEVAFMNRGGKENLKLLDEATGLRAQAAQLLGFKTHADYVAEDRMAKDAATVQAFLTRMRTGLWPGLEALRAKMTALKVADTKDKKSVITASDWRYYMNQIKKTDYAIDDEKVRAFFPAEKVMTGMFLVYSRLFGIELKEVAGAAVWANGVKLYEVRDGATNRLLAKFYVDLYPREGKYGHAAEFTLSAGRVVDGTATGAYRIPMAALVVNFQPPADGKVPHLSMNEVNTLFHEFGHVVHETLTTARFPSQAGTRTALDFVEAPSQMLENWAYQPEVLALISADPADPTKPLPAELAAKLAAARKYNAGVHYSRQVFLASFDNAIHTAPPSSLKQGNADVVARKLWAEIMKFPEDPAAHFAGTFGHMMGGYDGGYYGYLWSEVFAADMFTRFQKEGVLNPGVGRSYRDQVLARGRTVEPAVLLKDFLGRDPSEDAFLKLTGIKD